MNQMIGIVVSHFNSKVTSRLLKSCLDTLKDKGVEPSRVHTFFVPGGYEIPWAVQELALCGKYEAIIALGAIIKGATPQNDHISRSTLWHLHEVALRTRVPCILGVITPNTMAQAIARTKGGLDRGRQCALAALEMLVLRSELRSRPER
ncbi:MAG: 6,7-dimethyl-8-ribityllumazine synthase [Elusimicrobia bacterium RIFCSPHIGHO2_02_FULL_57_9]|nr:MAG: 6,7-dimethyl-8-ribityllumazine synthase [Elusimicrobia bacterium RIFCSPHIGHO2_02_FULL_57_9]